jgi:hypothetical protein
MIGGFQAVADALNAAYTWPGGRTIDRRQVESWHRRRTLNQLHQLPPSAVDVPYIAAGSGRPPRWQFETGHWVDWARHGVPGPRNKGWTVPELAAA